MRFVRIGAIATAIAIGAGGGAAPTYPTTANLWMGANGSCTRSATLVAYNPATSCFTMAAAYTAASNGDLVLVKCATYDESVDPMIAFNAGISAAGARVTFQPEAGACQVTMDLKTNSPDMHGPKALTIDGQNRWNFLNGAISDIPQNGSSCGVLGNQVTLENFSINGPINTRNAQNLLIKNVDVGSFTYPGVGQNAWGDSSRVGNYNCGSTNHPNNVTWDGVTFHDIFRGDSPSHAECLFIEASTNVTVQNSTFKACPIFAIFLKNDGPSGADDYQTGLVIQNNAISLPCPTTPPATGAECGNYGIREADCDNNAGNPLPSPTMTWTIRNNSLGPNTDVYICEDSTYWNAASTMTGNVVDQVTGAVGTCAGAKPGQLTNWTVDYSVYFTGTCGGANETTSTAGTEYASSGSNTVFDYRLNGGALALGRVATGFCPATDHDGNVRPGGVNCDAGAYKH